MTKWALFGSVSAVAAAVAVAAAIALLLGQSEPECGLDLFDEDFTSNPELEACVAGGHAEAQMAMGLMYWGASSHADPARPDTGEPITAIEAQAEGFRLLLTAAEKGSAAAAGEIGAAYFMGTFGRERDLATAKDWLDRGAAAGDEIAPYNLAQMHAGGFGIDPDPEAVRGYLRLSARRGYEPAQCVLNYWDRADPAPDALAGMFPCRQRDQGPSLEDYVFAAGSAIHAAWSSITTAISERSAYLAAEKPDARTCALYSAFADMSADRGDGYFAPTSRPEDVPFARRPGEGWAFERKTGEVRQVEVFTGTTVEVAATEPVEFDAEPMFLDLSAGPEFRISDCFESGAENVRFWSSTHTALHMRRYSRPTPEVSEITIWTLSRPGFSADGRHALVYGAQYCGLLCGQGSYYLFVQTESGWELMAETWEWFS